MHSSVVIPGPAGASIGVGPAELGHLTREDVGLRFKQAIRSGHPYWLWPNLPHEQWQTALHSIERAASTLLTNPAGAEHLPGVADAIGIAAYTSGTGPLLGYWIEQGSLSADPAVEAVLRIHLDHNRIRMDRMRRRAIEVMRDLREAGVATTILKGMHTAYCYFPESGTRPLSDIDVLIDPRDRRCAGQVLQEAGFILTATTRRIPTQENWYQGDLRREPITLAFVHADDPWSIDLQMMLNRQIAAGAPRLRLDEIAASANRAEWPLGGAGVLSQPILALALAVHASTPLINLSLLRVIELVLVIRRDSVSGSFDWSEFIAAAKEAQALGVIYPALVMCDKLVRGIVPASFLAASRFAAPEKAATFIDGLAPATAQQVIRCSFAERYLWTPTIGAKVLQTARDILLPGVPVSQLPSLWQKRVLRLARRTLTR